MKHNSKKGIFKSGVHVFKTVSDVSSLSLFHLFARFKAGVVVGVKDMMNDPALGTKIKKTVF